MTFSIQELKKRIKGAQGRFDLLNQFMELAENERAQVLDLLADVLTKVDGHKGCDPWKTILGR